MGRDLVWYVLTNTWDHDTSKLCFQWDYQPDAQDVLESILQNVDEINTPNEAWSYMYALGTKNTMCPTCLTFARGLYGSPKIIKSEHVGHGYSNPIWSSEWNIRNLCSGSHTPFVKRFRNDNMYSEITRNNVIYALEQLELLGQPRRTSDKEAYEESRRLLDFFIEWTSIPDVIVIFEDEF